MSTRALLIFTAAMGLFLIVSVSAYVATGSGDCAMATMFAGAMLFGGVHDLTLRAWPDTPPSREGV